MVRLPEVCVRIPVRSLCTTVAAAVLVAGLSAAEPAAAAYPGNDGQIAFLRGGDVWSIAADGSAARQLTRTGAAEYRPRWSPDGSRIAFVRETAAGARDVWVMRADGTQQQQVTSVGDVDAPPSWSPDGRQLVFSNGTRGRSQMRLVPSTVPFGQPRLVPGLDHTVDGSVVWAPDGRTIAFYNHDYPFSPDSYILTFDIVSRETELVDMIGGGCCGYGSFGDLAWSPDQKRLGRTYVEVTQAGQQKPPVVDVLTWPDVSLGTFRSQAGDRQPAFAPSGAAVVLVNADRLVVTRAYGAGRRVLTGGTQPDWQPR